MVVILVETAQIGIADLERMSESTDIEERKKVSRSPLAGRELPIANLIRLAHDSQPAVVLNLIDNDEALKRLPREVLRGLSTNTDLVVVSRLNGSIKVIQRLAQRA